METELNRAEKSIVDAFELDSDLFDKETLRASIITTAGRCEPMFTDPEFFYDCCAYFWSKYKYTFNKWFSALELEYNPIDNFSRHETRKFTPGVTSTETHSGTDTDTHSGTDTDTHSGTDTETPSGKVTVTNDTERGQSQTVETKVSAYEDSNYSPKEQVITTPGANQKDTNTSTTEYDDAKTEYEHGEVIETEHGEVIETAHGHVITDTKTGFDKTDIDITGNNGVSFPKLISEELETASFPIYQKITDIFCLELLITVY